MIQRPRPRLAPIAMDEPMTIAGMLLPPFRSRHSMTFTARPDTVVAQPARRRFDLEGDAV